MEIAIGRPHLLVTEQRLPGFCGLAVIEAARVARMSIPAILITEFGDAETSNHAALLGETPVLEKPFEMDRLLTLVRRALSRPQVRWRTAQRTMP